jgi:hypothetical protein
MKYAGPAISKNPYFPSRKASTTCSHRRRTSPAPPSWIQRWFAECSPSMRKVFYLRTVAFCLFSKYGDVNHDASGEKLQSFTDQATSEIKDPTPNRLFLSCDYQMMIDTRLFQNPIVRVCQRSSCSNLSNTLHRYFKFSILPHGKYSRRDRRQAT